MRIHDTDYGTVCIGTPETLFAELARIGAEEWRANAEDHFSWALTGGSTPKAWYRWCVEKRALPEELPATTQWFVGDERHVPLAGDESNFGNAARRLLDPLGAPAAVRHPWAVERSPEEAVAAFAREVAAVRGAGRAFSLCVLGLGDDAHTASLFPGSPLLGGGGGTELFAAVDVSGKGWRLTLTPAGLDACDRIVVHATGAAKAAAVRRVFCGGEPVSAVPAKLLEPLAAKVTWLLDPAAVAECAALGR